MRTSEECNAAPGYVFDNPTKTAADLCDQHLSRWHRLFTLIVTLDSEHEARHGKSAWRSNNSPSPFGGFKNQSLFRRNITSSEAHRDVRPFAN